LEGEACKWSAFDIPLGRQDKFLECEWVPFIRGGHRVKSPYQLGLHLLTQFWLVKVAKMSKIAEGSCMTDLKTSVNFGLIPRDSAIIEIATSCDHCSSVAAQHDPTCSKCRQRNGCQLNLEWEDCKSDIRGEYNSSAMVARFGRIAIFAGTAGKGNSRRRLQEVCFRH
jgi:hypothetical protein